MSLTQIQATDIQSSANISVARLYTANNLIFGIGGAETLRIDSNGFLGINTGANTNPIGGNTNARNLAVSGDGTLNSADGRLVLINPQPYANQTVGTTTAGRIYFSLPNASGGTTTSAAFIDALTAGSGGTGGYGLSLRFHPKADNSTDFVGATLDYNGNFGLGVTPSAWLWPNGTHGAFQLQSGAALSGYNSTTYLSQNYFYNTGEQYVTTGYALRYAQIGGSTGQHIWATSAASNSGSTSLTWNQLMTLDNSGNLLINTTSKTDSNGQYFVYSPGDETATIAHASGTGSGIPYLRFLYNGSVIGSITQSGTTAVLYNTTSDQRLKENIVDAESASSLIDAIQVRQYDWKSDGSHQRYGFIAQELVTVAPEAVHQPADPEEMMAVDYSKLVPMLVKAIQELKSELDIVKTELAALKS